ncbi:MAG TPA: hypothetical protein VFC43_06220 [Methanoregula sp.]|jgi:hypothetical protein|nr:hypothetical protein [Methanoregula sp.]
MRTNDSTCMSEVTIVPEVVDFINKRDCDFRICTSCGGPILLPVRVKPPKKTDLLLRAGNHMIYVSIHQARFLHSIRMDMVPFFDDDDLVGMNTDEF